ncbi:META domain-containing protein [Arthrobacter sp. I3]|uniref:META domain-containing protein n=1 Tax=Arthrobacter sp. I3 TaxID=218158 RepID=UPI0020A69436|nr:META domain-containing protein [Arthrobacter sp. I3]
MSNSPVPATSGAPQETCAAFLPAAPCATYSSVAATSNGKALRWAAAGTITVRLASVEDTLQLAMRTDCSPISGPATIAGNTLTIEKIATGASGCIGAAGEHQAWLHELLKRPISMTYTQDTLTWTSGTNTLSFQAE